MTVIIDSEVGGIVRNLTLDGLDYDIMPIALPLTLEPLQDFVNTIDGGSVAFGVYAGVGHADSLNRLSADLTFDQLTGPTLKRIQRILAQGGYHKLCYWKPIFAFYTATAGQSRFILPRYRQNAGTVYAGLIRETVAVSTTSVPFRCWINSVAQTVIYENGPTVVRPAAGSVTVGRDTITSGVDQGYAEFRVGNTLVAGDVVEIEWCPVYTGAIISPRHEFPQTIVESISFTFQER